MPGFFHDRCARCGGVIPSAFNVDEPVQYCPSCHSKLDQDIRGSTALNDNRQARFDRR